MLGSSVVDQQVPGPCQAVRAQRWADAARFCQVGSSRSDSAAPLVHHAVGQRNLDAKHQSLFILEQQRLVLGFHVRERVRVTHGDEDEAVACSWWVQNSTIHALSFPDSYSRSLHMTDCSRARARLAARLLLFRLVPRERSTRSLVCAAIDGPHYCIR